MKTKEKILRYSWEELSSEQKEEAKQQLMRAGWKDPEKYSKLTFQVTSVTGKIYGWIDKNFFA